MTKTRIGRIVAFLLTFVMIFALVPQVVFGNDVTIYGMDDMIVIEDITIMDAPVSVDASVHWRQMSDNLSIDILTSFDRYVLSGRWINVFDLRVHPFGEYEDILLVRYEILHNGLLVSDGLFPTDEIEQTLTVERDSPFADVLPTSILTINPFEWYNISHAIQVAQLEDSGLYDVLIHYIVEGVERSLTVGSFSLSVEEDLSVGGYVGFEPFANPHVTRIRAHNQAHSFYGGPQNPTLLTNVTIPHTGSGRFFQTMISVEGTNLPHSGGRTQVGAFLNNTGAARYAQTGYSYGPSGGWWTLNFPANTGTTDRRYTLRVSFNSGSTWVTPATTTTITVSARPVQTPTFTIGSTSTTINNTNLTRNISTGGTATGTISVVSWGGLPMAVDVRQSGNTIVVSGVRPSAGQAAVIGTWTVRVARQGITRDLAITVNLTPVEPVPPTFNLSPITTTINDANLSRNITASGTATGTISVVNRGNLPAAVDIRASGNTITVSAARPAAGQPAIAGTFTVTLRRQGVDRQITITVNLTPTAPIRGPGGDMWANHWPLHIRRSRSYADQSGVTLARAEHFYVLYTQDGWAHGRNRNGHTGWVPLRYLSSANQAIPFTYDQIRWTSQDYVLRRTRSYNAPHPHEWLRQGEEVRVLRTYGFWARVRVQSGTFNGREGYVHRSFLAGVRPQPRGQVDLLTNAQVLQLMNRTGQTDIPNLQNVPLLDLWSGEVTYIAMTLDWLRPRTRNGRFLPNGRHSDWTPMTPRDVRAVQNIGAWSWNSRPGIITLNGRRIAVGFHIQPHLMIINPASPGYPLTRNNFGHMCLYFGDSVGGDTDTGGQSHRNMAVEAQRLGNALLNANALSMPIVGVGFEAFSVPTDTQLPDGAGFVAIDSGTPMWGAAFASHAYPNVVWAGTTVEIEALANSYDGHFVFVQWEVMEGNAIIENPLLPNTSFVMPAGEEIVSILAIFQPHEDNIAISATVNNENMGFVWLSHEYQMPGNYVGF